MERSVPRRQSLIVEILIVAVILASTLSHIISSGHIPDTVGKGGPGAVIYWNDVRQTIAGFGISSAWTVDDLMKFPEPSRTEILELLFSQSSGAGFSIVRNEIGSGGGIPATSSTQTIEPAEGVWNWTGDEGQIWVMNQARRYGVTTFVSSVWSPPAWMKTNGSVTNGGYLRTDKYQAFAEYLAQYILGYKSQHGLDVYAVSPANEPNIDAIYQSCLWTGRDFDTFIKDYLKPTFTKDNVPARIILPESSMWSDNLASNILRDKDASTRLDIVAAHDYSAAQVNPLWAVKSQKKEQWQTEVSSISLNDPGMTDGLYWAKRIYQHMTDAESNAWLWWLAVHPLGPNVDGEGLINIDVTDGTFAVAKRLYTIGNYSRFIRPGYVRIASASYKVSNVYVSAYKASSTGTFVVVAVNQGNTEQPLNVMLNHFSASAVTPYETSNTKNLQQLPALPVSNGEFSVTLPAQSVTTFVGEGTSAPID